MIFKNTDELFTYLSEYYEDYGGTVDIATFGMYLGISKGMDWSEKYPTPVRKFIDKIKKEDLRLVLGLTSLIECKPDCEECKTNYNKVLDRHVETVIALNLNVRFHPNLHLKMYRVGLLYISGGINLGASDAIDASFDITDPVQQEFFRDMFEDTWAMTERVKLDRYRAY